MPMMSANSDSGVYLGWFDSASKRAEVAPRGHPSPHNFLAILIEGPSRVGHYVRPAYRTSDGRGGHAQDGPTIRPDARVHEWTLSYSPAGAGGSGRIEVTTIHR